MAILDRKPRFSPQQSPPPAHSHLHNSVPLSRNNSNISSVGNTGLTRSCSTQSKGGGRSDSREDQYSTVSSESRKIGRFELTSHSDLRHSVVDSSKG